MQIVSRGPHQAATSGATRASFLAGLVQDALLTQDQAERVRSHASAANQAIEDAILNLGFMTEPTLLKWLAAKYRTQFVSTEKLSRASVTQRLLTLVPQRHAERLKVFPIIFKRESNTLAVVACDPSAHNLAQQLEMITDVKSIKVYVARPAAIDAAIAKHYRRDSSAFARINGEPESSGFGDFGLDGTSGFSGLGGPDTGTFDMFEAPAGPSPKAPPPPAFTISAPDIVADLKALKTQTGRPPPSPDTESRSRTSSRSRKAPSSAPPPPAQGITPEAFLETLHVMTALLEKDRGELRTHTADVVRLTRKMAEQIGLKGQGLHHLLMAAYLHDIGKASNYHLTPLNVARYEGHRVQAEKTYLTPVRLFETASLPEGAARILRALYERHDGKGFPEGLTGKEIPLGARILAVVETYADLTRNKKNPYRQLLTPAQGCEAVSGFREKIFDPTLCDVLRRVVMGNVESKLLSERRTVLLVDSDPEETTVLDMRFSSAGFDVLVARDAEEATTRLKRGVDAVVCEVELPGSSGFDLLKKIREERDTPVIFLTVRGDRAGINRGFELGAADYLVKPTSPDVVVAKTSQLLERDRSGGRGVTGSLREMSLPDVVQVLSNGRRNGRLIIKADGKQGEVHFGEGAIWQATFGPHKGEDAFYAMLLLTDGEFQLDPSFVPSTRAIQKSTEGLLLEGMRRMDEGDR